MNVQDIVSRVQIASGDTAEALIHVTDILSWINDGQLDITRKTKCLVEHARTPSTGGDSSYGLPDGFLEDQEVQFKGVNLDKVTRQFADQYNPFRDSVGGPPGIPTRYWIQGNLLNVFPPPIASGENIDMWFVREPVKIDSLGDSLDIPATLHLELLKYCISKAKEVDEEDAKAQAVMADYDIGISEAKDNLQGGDSYPAIRALPGDDGGWDYGGNY